MIKGHTQSEGRITVFHLRDDLTTKRAKAFSKKVDALLRQGRHFLILDISEVEEICLLGQVAISSLSNKCRHAGGSLKIAGLSYEVRRSFKRTNLINTIETYDTVLDAVKSYRSENLLKRKNYSGSYYLKDRKAFVAWDELPIPEYVH